MDRIDTIALSCYVNTIPNEVPWPATTRRCSRKPGGGRNFFFRQKERTLPI